MSAAFTSEFRSIVGADISSEAGRSGTVYRGDAELVSLQAAGAISGIATEGGAGVRALFLCTEDPVTSSGDVELAIGGQTLTITSEGAYFTDADLAAGALTPAVTVTSSGTSDFARGLAVGGTGDGLMQTDVCDGCLIILRWGDVRQWGNYRYCAVCYEAAAGGDTDVDGDPPGESESQSGTWFRVE